MAQSHLNQTAEWWGAPAEPVEPAEHALKMVPHTSLGGIHS